jgi:hypothetical protein
LVKEVIREERSRDFYINDEGYLVFLSEKAYADYLNKQPDKYPSEVRAYFINEQGYKTFYSDFVPTPKKARELKEARKEPTVDAEVVWQRLKKRGVKV